MTIIKHELKQGAPSLFLFTASIASLLMLCVFLFPEMQSDMNDVGTLFASMGSFTAAFGMDRLNLGTLTGFYAVECGNIIGLGGALYAALLGISVLSKEKKERTAEFLLTHPITRRRVLTEKLLAMLVQITVLNILVSALSMLSIWMIGETVPLQALLLMHTAYLLMQLELSALCFGLSAFLRRFGTGIGLALAATAYALNLIANMTKGAALLRWLTPFGYCDGADILSSGTLDFPRIAAGMAAALVVVLAAYAKYERKDIG